MSETATPVSRHWADFLPPDLAPPLPPGDPWGDEIDRPGATWLTVTDDPLSEFRPFRDYSRDGVVGEPRYRFRDHYDMNTDATTIDDRGGEILIGDQRGASTIGGAASHRIPTAPSEGQRLRRNRLGTGNRNDGAGKTLHKPDPRGLQGGTGAPAGLKSWTITPPAAAPFTVEAKNERQAKRRAKEVLGLAARDPWPAGARVGREA